MTMEYVSGIFAIFLITVMIIMLIVSFSKFKETKPKRRYKFEIVYSAGTYDIRLDGIRLVSKHTYSDAMDWLDEHREFYIEPERISYVEEYEEVNGKIKRIK